MEPTITNQFMDICDGCPNIDTETNTMFTGDKPYYIVVGCTHAAECARAYAMGRKEAGSEMR